MPELLNHSHCKNCGRAVRFDDDVCGEECAKEFARFQKRRSRTALLFYAAGAFFIVFLLTQLFTGLF